MKERPQLVSKEQALEEGLHLYGQIEPLFSPAGTDLEPTEVATRVAIVNADTNSAVLSSTTEREVYHLRWTYEREVRRDIRQAARYLGSVATLRKI